MGSIVSIESIENIVLKVLQQMFSGWMSKLKSSITYLRKQKSHSTSMLLERQKPTLYQQDILEERAKITP